jgi:Zn-dependent protease
MFYSVNIGLAVFNIIPVPPLDGSKILSGILPNKYYFKLIQYENYIGIIFLILIFAVPGVLSTILSPLISLVDTAIMFIVKGILGVLL